MKFWSDLFDKIRFKRRITMKMQEKILLNFYILVLFFSFALLMIPILRASFSYCMYHLDDLDHALGVHLAWKNNKTFHGFLMALLAAAHRVKEMYLGWGGNYTSFFFTALQPIAFSEKLNFTGTFIFLSAYLISQYRFMNELFCKTWKMNKKVMLVIYLLVVILGTQWLTSANEAFFWYAGCVPNTLGFAAGLEIIRIYLQTVRTYKMSLITFVWGIIITIFTAGCNYSSLLALFLILVFVNIDIWYKKELKFGVRLQLIIFFLGLVLFGIISIIAPGNAVRQTYNTGTDAFHAIIMAVMAGKDRIVMFTDYKMWAFTLLLAPYLWNALDENEERRLPLFVLFISFGIFCAMFSPTMKSDMTVGPRRTRNLYWWAYLDLYCINMTYILGWIKYKIKRRIPDVSLTISPSCQLFLLGVMFIFLCFTLEVEDLKQTPSVITYFELKSGKYAEFDSLIEERNRLYYSDADNIEIKHVDYLPYLIFGGNEEIYPNDIGKVIESKYYQKETVKVLE